MAAERFDEASELKAKARLGWSGVGGRVGRGRQGGVLGRFPKEGVLGGWGGLGGGGLKVTQLCWDGCQEGPGENGGYSLYG